MNNPIIDSLRCALSVIICLLVFVPHYNFAQSIANDLCKNAIALPVTATPDFQLYTTTNSTPSGIYQPNCYPFTASYKDVWFTAIVPVSGRITIETRPTNGGLSNTVLQAFARGCNNLKQIACDDNDGVGQHAKIELMHRTAGEQIWIRVGDFGNDETGDFLVAAYDGNTNNCVCSGTGEADETAPRVVGFNTSRTWTDYAETLNGQSTFIELRGNELVYTCTDNIYPRLHFSPQDVIITENCPSNPIEIFVETDFGGQLTDCRETEVRWRVRDECGNESVYNLMVKGEKVDDCEGEIVFEGINFDNDYIDANSSNSIFVTGIITANCDIKNFTFETYSTCGGNVTSTFLGFCSGCINESSCFNEFCSDTQIPIGNCPVPENTSCPCSGDPCNFPRCLSCLDENDSCCELQYIYELADDFNNRLQITISGDSQTRFKESEFGRFKEYPEEDCDNDRCIACDVNENVPDYMDEGGFPIQNKATIQVTCEEWNYLQDNLIACFINCNVSGGSKISRARRFFQEENCKRARLEFTDEVYLDFEIADCPNDILLGEQRTESGNYLALHQIVSNQPLASDAIVNFTAGNSIELLAGFTTTDAKSFTASVQSLENCSETNERSNNEDLQEVLSGKYDFQLHPNPTDDVVNVTLSNTKEATILVLNIQGQILQRMKYLNITGDIPISLPTSNLENGIYFIQVRQAEYLESKKLIIQH